MNNQSIVKHSTKPRGELIASYHVVENGKDTVRITRIRHENEHNSGRVDPLESPSRSWPIHSS